MGPIDQTRVLAELLASYQATQDNDVEQRASLLPLARYSDGQTHPAWPGILAAPLEGFQNMWERGDEANISNPDALAQLSRESFDAAGLAATGGLAAGMVGAVPEGAVAANGIGGKIKGWFGKSEPEIVAPPAEAYWDGNAAKAQAKKYWHEYLSGIPEGVQPDAVTGSPFSARLYRGSEGHKLKEAWATSSPREASTYATDGNGIYGGEGHGRGQIAPLDVQFNNPLVIDAQGHRWGEIPYGGVPRMTDDIVDQTIKEMPDVDGVVFRNVTENLVDEPATTVRAIKRGTVRSALTGDLLYSNSPNAASVPLAINAMEKPKGFTAYHGSPHDFDKFDLSKIGTGEGAQAYGHGLYFAENEGVARSYRDNISDNRVPELQLSDKVPPRLAQAIREIQADPNTRILSQQGLEKRDFGVPGYDDQLDALIASGDVALPAHKGKMYEVNINADPEQFLDWDRPLSEQPFAQQALSQFDIPHIKPESLGRHAYRHVLDSDRPPGMLEGDVRQQALEGASRRLRDAGIAGVRYLDQGSRDMGSGSRNYVLFDDSLVDINRKYANHPFASASPLAFTDYEDQPRPNRKLAELLAQ